MCKPILGWDIFITVLTVHLLLSNLFVIFFVCSRFGKIATNLLIGEQKVRQAFQIGKIGEPLFRFFLRIYNYHIKLQIIKLLVMIYIPCNLPMLGVLVQRHQLIKRRNLLDRNFRWADSKWRFGSAQRPLGTVIPIPMHWIGRKLFFLCFLIVGSYHPTSLNIFVPII